MGERIGRIGRIKTDFFQYFILNRSENQKIILKKIRFNPPDPLNPFSHSITIVSHVLNSFIPNSEYTWYASPNAAQRFEYEQNRFHSAISKHPNDVAKPLLLESFDSKPPCPQHLKR
jgi:hypothetical protein